jgi:enoyl-CoA hydratase/carnithine racemase
VSNAIRYERVGGVAVLTLNRPERFNSISLELMESLLGALDTAESDADVRTLVLAATGKHFCTGADLDEVMQQRASRARLAEFIGRGHEVLSRIEASPLPVLAAINGYCLAGGLELMMAADIVVAAADARIGCQHARYGLVPGWGGTQRLPRLVGLRRALDLMYSARWLDAAEAMHWGLVNRVVAPEELRGAVLDEAATLSMRNPEGLATMKKLARRGLELPLPEGLSLERNEAVRALRSDNVSEGLQAFRERREPRFR